MPEQQDNAPIRYIERTHAYYLALGYDNPYRWASFADVPFVPLTTPLAAVRLALVTTAAPYRPGAGDQGPGAPYNGAAKFFQVYTLPSDTIPDLRISHVAYDRDHTSAADPNTWLPLQQLHLAVERGRLGALTPRLYGAPTNRSRRVTSEVDAPAILERCRADAADVALLVPTCPVCHQTVSLIARHLEAHGIPTVIMGCALDIVAHCGVPRFVFSDFPLGNSAGKPFDPDSQAETLELALQTLETATAPRTIVHSPQRWSDDPAWKADYSNPARLSPQEIAERRRAFDAAKVARQR